MKAPDQPTITGPYLDSDPVRDRVREPDRFGSDADLRFDPEGLSEFDPNSEAERQRERTARRIVGAFVIIVVLGMATFAILPQVGVHFPPYALLLAFGAIVLGAVMTMAQGGTPRRTPEPDNARPLGCCGPRPIGEMSRRNDGCGSCR